VSGLLEQTGSLTRRSMATLVCNLAAMLDADVCLADALLSTRYAALAYDRCGTWISTQVGH